MHILTENTSTKIVHLKKNCKLGSLDIVEDIKIPFDVQNSRNFETPPPSINEVINVIQPTKEIIKLREAEFERAKLNLNHLSTDEKEKIKEILKSNFQSFSSSLNSLGHTDIIEPQIHFTTDYPIKTLPFPIPQALQAETKRQIDEMVEAGIIEKNIASWACPILLVKKRSIGQKPETYRMTLDLRLLNAVIQHSSYPLPKIQQLITKMAGYKYFTSLDMPSAYHQVNLPDKYQERICFTSPFGTYKLKRMPQGLKTSAGHFQELPDTIVEEVDLPGIVTYIDDFIICSNSFQETIDKLDKLLKVFKKHNLTLNLEKCSFHTISVNYLGFKIENHNIFPVTSNIIKINSFPKPKTKRQLKKFLGLCGFYRTLIPSYAKLTIPHQNVDSFGQK